MSERAKPYTKKNPSGESEYSYHQLAPLAMMVVARLPTGSKVDSPDDINSLLKHCYPESTPGAEGLPVSVMDASSIVQSGKYNHFVWNKSAKGFTKQYYKHTSKPTSPLGKFQPANNGQPVAIEIPPGLVRHIIKVIMHNGLEEWIRATFEKFNTRSPDAVLQTVAEYDPKAQLSRTKEEWRLENLAVFWKMANPGGESALAAAAVESESAEDKLDSPWEFISMLQSFFHWLGSQRKLEWPWASLDMQKAVFEEDVNFNPFAASMAEFLGVEPDDSSVVSSVSRDSTPSNKSITISSHTSSSEVQAMEIDVAESRAKMSERSTRSASKRQSAESSRARGRRRLSRSGRAASDKEESGDDPEELGDEGKSADELEKEESRSKSKAAASSSSTKAAASSSSTVPSAKQAFQTFCEQLAPFRAKLDEEEAFTTEERATLSNLWNELMKSTLHLASKDQRGLLNTVLCGFATRIESLYRWNRLHDLADKFCPMSAKNNPSSHASSRLPFLAVWDPQLLFFLHQKKSDLDRYSKMEKKQQMSQVSQWIPEVLGKKGWRNSAQIKQLPPRYGDNDLFALGSLIPIVDLSSEEEQQQGHAAAAAAGSSSGAVGVKRPAEQRPEVETESIRGPATKRSRRHPSSPRSSAVVGFIEEDPEEEGLESSEAVQQAAVEAPENADLAGGAFEAPDDDEEILHAGGVDDQAASAAPLGGGGLRAQSDGLVAMDPARMHAAAQAAKLVQNAEGVLQQSQANVQQLVERATSSLDRASSSNATATAKAMNAIITSQEVNQRAKQQLEELQNFMKEAAAMMEAQQESMRKMVMEVIESKLSNVGLPAASSPPCGPTAAAHTAPAAAAASSAAQINSAAALSAVATSSSGSSALPESAAASSSSDARPLAGAMLPLPPGPHRLSQSAPAHAGSAAAPFGYTFPSGPGGGFAVAPFGFGAGHLPYPLYPSPPQPAPAPPTINIFQGGPQAAPSQQHGPQWPAVPTFPFPGWTGYWQDGR